MNPQSYLSNMKSKLDRVYTTSELNQAVETLYQFDHLDRKEYENWIAEIKAIESKRTEQLLKNAA
ncbi:hypothetical protein EXE30_06700 [Acinetobacter halotolerans]|uniref:Uncharacterized protein n=1 Tax=Acinetobacter halotolerans TaxID=1752076 RepID=A0A4Q6XBG7_9GAMM|nr:hypothetical protein [Acinetobacter halotolerans]RZF53658.1 hypothetical protein EXE30_06700 [Acinetobacter halotolerans]